MGRHTSTRERWAHETARVSRQGGNWIGGRGDISSIGAGPGCDGQVLVLHDMLGLNEGFNPKFLKLYAELSQTVRAAANAFTNDVRAGRYPTKDHSFD